MQQFSDYLRLCQFIGKRFLQDHAQYRAAALTLTSLLSIVPLMVVSLSIFTAFPVFQSYGVDIQAFIFKNLVPTSGEVVQQYLQGFVEQASQLPALGMLFLIVTAVLMLFTMEQAFNIIWRVHKRRKGVAAFLLYWAILTLSPILMGLSLVVSSYIVSLPVVLDTAKYLGIYSSLLSLSAFSLVFLALTLVYVAVPNCQVKIRYAMIAALVAALLFELTKIGFTFYVTRFPTYHLLYGALSVIPIFILWVYLSWIIVLFGAVTSYALTYRKSVSKAIKLDAFSQAILWLYQLSEAQKQGKILSLARLVHLDDYAYEEEPEVVIQALVDSGLVQRVNDGHVLLKELVHISLRDLYLDLPWALPSSKKIAEYENPWLNNLSQLLKTMNQKVDQELNLSIQDLFEEKQQ